MRRNSGDTNQRFSTSEKARVDVFAPVIPTHNCFIALQNNNEEVGRFDAIHIPEEDGGLGIILMQQDGENIY